LSDDKSRNYIIVFEKSSREKYEDLHEDEKEMLTKSSTGSNILPGSFGDLQF
jgi:hypothetical protein